MSDKGISGWWLTRIRLREWGVFEDCEFSIPLGCGLHLGGDSGMGKSTILDAILWALIGDGNMIRFNAGVGIGERRSLRRYVRCYLDAERRCARDAGIAHVLLEFTHADTGSVTTVGSVIAYGRSGRLKKAFLIADLPATADLLMRRAGSGWEPVPIDVLHEHAREHRKRGVHFRVVRAAAAYRERLSRKMGDLPLHFFSGLGYVMGRDYASVDLDGLVRETLFGSAPVEFQPCGDQVAPPASPEAGREVAGDVLRGFLDEVSARHAELESTVEEVNRMILAIGFGLWRCRFALSPVDGNCGPLMRDLLQALDAWKQHRCDARGTWAAFARKHSAVLERLSEALAVDGAELSREESAQLAALTVPSQHFACEMQVRPEGSEWVNAACLVGWMRDKERQMLVQAVLVAAMLWVYGDHPNRPRLVPIPEVFAEIPDVLAAILKVMRELGLQPVVTAPVGAFEVEQAMDYTIRLYRDPDDPTRRRWIQKRRLLSDGGGVGGETCSPRRHEYTKKRA